MKKIIGLTITLFAVLFATACEDSVGPVIESDTGNPVLTSPDGGESYVLNEEDADQELLNLSWEAPDFGFQAAVTYVIEMDPEGNGFEEPATFAETSQTSVSMTVRQVNERLISAGVPFAIESEVDFRIRAHVNDSVDDKISEVFTLMFTPYEIVIEYPEIFVPGSYQSASGYTSDWSPADAPPLYSTSSDNRYEGYVYVAADEQMFKFTEDRSWDVNWGDDGADGTLEQNGADIPVNAGYYKMNVNLNSMNYTLLNTSWAVIGDATGSWDTDTDLEYDVENKVWRTTMDLSAGEMKFRANDAWDLNFGSENADGTLQEGTDNIPVTEAGTYTIELDLSGPVYRYSIELN